VPQDWAGQQIRINALFRDGLGKNETVFGSPLKLPAALVSQANTGGTTTTAATGSATTAATTTNTTATTPIQPQATPQGSRFSVTRLADASEGQAVIFQVERTGLINQIATVQVETMNDSARMGADYIGKVENVWFDAGETKKLVHISTLTDSQKEQTERFSLSLRIFNSNHSLVPGRGIAQASIFNVDPVTGQQGSPTIVAATSGSDRLSGSSGRDWFQMAASPNVVATSFRPDLIVAFDPQQGDKIQLSRSAYRFKAGNVNFAQVRNASEQQTAFNTGTSVVYDQSSGLLSVNAKATIDGSEGPILQLLNKPFINSLSSAIETI